MPNIVGCYFHLMQALTRKAGNIGLKNAQNWKNTQFILQAIKIYLFSQNELKTEVLKNLRKLLES